MNDRKDHRPPPQRPTPPEGRDAAEVPSKSRRDPAGEDLSETPQTPKKTPLEKAPAKKAPAKKAPAKKAPAKKAPAKKTPAKQAPTKQAPTKKASAGKAPARKAPAKKAPTKKAPAKKAPTKKAPAKKAPAKKAPAKQAPTKQTPVKKAPAGKAPAKKAPAKKAPAKTTPAKTTPAEPASTGTRPSSLVPTTKAPPTRASAGKATTKKAPAKKAPAKSAPEQRAPATAVPTEPTPTRASPAPGTTREARTADEIEQEFRDADPADTIDVVDEAAATEPDGGGRSLLSASVTPAIGTALSRITGLMRVAALTAALGLTTIADVYNLANTAPNILYELVIGGVLSSTLVPMFIHAKDDPEDNSASAIVTVAFVAITALTLIAVLAAPLINHLLAISLDGSERERQLSIGDDFLILLLPQIFFYGMMTISTAILHARRRFAAPAFAPVLTNIVISAAALSVLWFVDTDGPSTERTVWVLGLGTTAGIAAMAIAVLPSVRRANVRLNWTFQPKHPAVRMVLRLSGWTVGFAIANQVSLLVVLTLARGVGVGAVSSYQYAFIFFQLPFGLIAVSIMTAVLPELATAARAGDDKLFGERFTEGLSLLLTFMLPAAGAYLFVGSPLIELLLQRGQFDAAATEQTARMLDGFAIGLPPFAIFLYCVRAFHARRNTRTPFYTNLLKNILNVALVIPLIATIGEFGLPLAYSMAYSVAAVIALVVLGRSVPGLYSTVTWNRVLRVLLVAAAVIVWMGVAHMYVSVDAAVGQVLVVALAAIVTFIVSIVLCRPRGFEPLLARLPDLPAVLRSGR